MVEARLPHPPEFRRHIYYPKALMCDCASPGVSPGRRDRTAADPAHFE